MMDGIIFEPHSRTEIIPFISYFCFLSQEHDMTLTIACILHV